jgi:mannose-1-phosphate guanylyltransferase
MKKHDNFGLKVDFSEHTLEGGTAQGFKLAIKRFVKDDNFLAMNGDELTNMNLSKFFARHTEKKSLVTMALAPFHCRFSVVELDDGKISGFKYGYKLPNVPVSIGIYLFNFKIYDLIPEKGSIEDLVFAKLAKEKKMESYMFSGDEEWVSVNTIKDIADAEERIKVWFSKHSA